MFPVLGWEVVESKQRVSILTQAIGRLLIFQRVALDEGVATWFRPSRSPAALVWLSAAGFSATWRARSRVCAPTSSRSSPAEFTLAAFPLRPDRRWVGLFNAKCTTWFADSIGDMGRRAGLAGMWPGTRSEPATLAAIHRGHKHLQTCCYTRRHIRPRSKLVRQERKPQRWPQSKQADHRGGSSLS